jgi:hypothetical protein
MRTGKYGKGLLRGAKASIRSEGTGGVVVSATKLSVSVHNNQRRPVTKLLAASGC